MPRRERTYPVAFRVPVRVADLYAALPDHAKAALREAVVRLIEELARGGDVVRACVEVRVEASSAAAREEARARIMEIVEELEKTTLLTEKGVKSLAKRLRELAERL